MHFSPEKISVRSPGNYMYPNRVYLVHLDGEIGANGYDHVSISYGIHSPYTDFSFYGFNDTFYVCTDGDVDSVNHLAITSSGG